MYSVYFTGPTSNRKIVSNLSDVTFKRRQRAKSFTIDEPTLQLVNCDMDFHLDTQYLITNNRYMQLIEPTIRQALLQGDKEST